MTIGDQGGARLRRRCAETRGGTGSGSQEAAARNAIASLLWGMRDWRDRHRITARENRAETGEDNRCRMRLHEGRFAAIKGVRDERAAPDAV